MTNLLGAILLLFAQQSIDYETGLESIDSNLPNAIEGFERGESGVFLGSSSKLLDSQKDLIELKSWISQRTARLTGSYNPRFGRSEEEYDSNSTHVKKTAQQIWLAIPFARTDSKGRYAVDSIWPVGKLGYVIDDQPMYDGAKPEFDRWIATVANSATVLFQPILYDPGKDWFIIHKKQLAFFATFYDACNACFELSKFNQKLYKKELSYLDIPQDAKYHLIVKRHQAWPSTNLTFADQYNKQTTKMGRMSVFMKPMMLEHVKFRVPVAPSVKAVFEVPMWVRLRYAEVVNAEVGILWSTEEWIHAGWKRIRQKCSA